MGKGGRRCASHVAVSVVFAVGGGVVVVHSVPAAKICVGLLSNCFTALGTRTTGGRRELTSDIPY